jgi:hypothetical protein
MESDDAPQVAGEGMRVFVATQHLKQVLVVPVGTKPIFCTAFGLVNAARGVELGYRGVGVQPRVLIGIHCSLRGKLAAYEVSVANDGPLRVPELDQHLAKVVDERRNLHGFIFGKLLPRALGALIRVNAVGHIDVGVAGVNKRVHFAEDFRHAVGGAVELAEVAAHILHVPAEAGGMWRGRLEAKGKKPNKKGKLSEGMTRT